MNVMKFWALLLLGLSSAASAAEFPQVKVTSVRRVFHNGEHNAFTDLYRFRDRFYLTFRSCPDGHGVNPTASVIVLTSDDARDWRQVARFSVPHRDARDPHFLEFRGKLFVYSGTWYCGETAPKSYDINQQLGYAISSADGETWSDPVMLEGTYGHYIWRAAAHGDKAYLCGRRKREFVENIPRGDDHPITESAILESDDGLIWRTAGLFQKTRGNETAFLFEPDGSVLAVARTGGSGPAQVCRAKAPNAEFTQVDLDRFVGGPLLAKWGNRTLVGGRKMIGGPPVTSLYWLDKDKLIEFATLPSGGDNSYPGFVPLSETRGLVSYYSTHEKDDAGKPITAIYLAELEIDQTGN